MIIKNPFVRGVASHLIMNEKVRHEKGRVYFWGLCPLAFGNLLKAHPDNRLLL